MTVPVGHPRLIQHDINGKPAVGWKLHVYEVGTLDNKTSYSDADLTVANTNPIILDSLGMAQVYYNGRARLIMKDSADVTKWEEPDVSVSPDDPAEWIGSQDASFTSGTSFTVLADQTAILHVNRRMRVTGSGFGTIYGSITSSSYSSPLTTVTLSVDSGTMDNTLITAEYSVLSANNLSVPANAVVGKAIIDAVGKTTPVDSDELVITDSAASNALKSLTWANVKATLKTYFDSLTTTLTNKDSSGVSNISPPTHVSVLTSGTDTAFTVASLPDTLATGRIYEIRMDQSNNSSFTITPGAGSAINVRLANGELVPSGWARGGVSHRYLYNGTNLVLLDPFIDRRQANYTGTLTGCSTSPTGAVRYKRVGLRVIIQITTGAFTGTSNATTMTITGAPADIRMAAGTTSPQGVVKITDNGTAKLAMVDMDENGTLTFTNVDGTGFTASGTKAVNSLTFTYLLTT